MNVRNHIHLTGNLGADPKTVTLKTGQLATEFSLATNEYYRDAAGNRQTRTEWHRIKAFGKLAELFDTHLKSGSMISIIGSMRYRKWLDKFEQVRTSSEVIAEEFTFLSSGKPSISKETKEGSGDLVAAPEAKPSTKKATSRRTKSSQKSATLA